MGKFSDLASALNGADPLKAMEAIRDKSGPKNLDQKLGEWTKGVGRTKIHLVQHRGLRAGLLNEARFSASLTLTIRNSFFIVHQNMTSQHQRAKYL